MMGPLHVRRDRGTTLLGKRGLLALLVLMAMTVCLGTAARANASEVGAISGHVTSAATESSLAGIEVCATRQYEMFEEYYYEYFEEEYVERCEITGAGGSYTVSGLPSGSYTVLFRTPLESSLNYSSQFYSGKANRSEAQPVSVTSGSTTSAINAAMQAGARIGGTITDATTKAPVGGILVCAFERAGEGREQCALSNGSGEYLVPGLRGGEYTVEYGLAAESTLNYLRQYYKAKTSAFEAQPVSVASGATTTGIDAALAEGGEITGTVTDAVTKAAIAGIQACVGGTAESPYRCVLTNASGKYTLAGLSTGEHFVEFSSPPEGTLSYLSHTTSGVAVTVGAVTSGVNAALENGAQIAGKVTSASSKAALQGIQVCAYSETTEIGECATTDASGAYTIRRLATGSYIVYFTPPYYSSSLNYLLQYYKGTANYEEATPVSVTAGAVTTGIDAALLEGGTITGHVTDATTKAAIRGIEVCAESLSGTESRCAGTNASGEYHVSRLSSGSYRVRFGSPYYYGSGRRYVSQYYNGKGSYSEADSVAVTAGSTASGIDASLVEAGSITGKVTNAVTKAAIAGVTVCASGSGEFAFGCAETIASGEYRIAGLPAGEYKVYFNATRYILQYYNGKATSAEANPVAATTGKATTGIDAALTEAGRITGTVTDAASKAAVEHITVCARKSNGESAGQCGFTTASGEYEIQGLPTGEYKVEFSSFSFNLNYATQYYHGKATLAEAEPVAVTAGSATSGINAALQEGGKVTGKVTDAATKAALVGVTACVSGPTSGCATTNSSGEYTVTRLSTGNYTVWFSASAQNYITQYYNGKSSFAEADLVAVTVAKTTTGIDAALKVGGMVKGTVTSATSKAAISGLSVCAAPTGGGIAGCAATGVNGEYTIVGLAAGQYRIEFFGNGSTYSTQYYNGKTNFTEADLVTVTTGGTTSGIDAAMGLAGSVAGTVTDASTKAGVQGIQVCARRRSGEYATGCATTGTGGKYTVSGLIPGEYVVEFTPGSSVTANYAPQFYNGKVSFAEATGVQVASGASTGEVNAALIEGGEVSGKVTDAATKAALSGATVCASETLAEIAVRCATTNASGEYTITSLTPGKYRVRFFSNSGEYATRYYDAAASFASAQVVAVANGVDVEGLDAAMGGGGKIAGVVTSASSKAAIAGILVCAGEACATTNSSGEYTLIGLRAGEYTVSFRGNGLNYVPRYYNEKAAAAEATHVAVAVHATTGSINAAMSEGGQIGGLVTDSSTKAALSGVSVCAAPHGNATTSECTLTNASGEYTISGLPAGSFDVSFSPSGQNYLPQYYNNRSSSGEADPVAVTIGTKAAPINAALLQGGHVRGTVTSASSKSPLGFVLVCASRRGGGSGGGCTKTSLAGEYDIGGLPSGEYTVSFNGSAVGYITQYYNNKSSAGEASAVSITAGTTTAGINAALEEGGKISGKVTDAVSKAAIPAIEIYVYDGTGTQVTSAVTKPNGEYVADGLPAGEYRVKFVSTSHAYEDQYYNSKSELAKANPVAVTAAGHVTPAINAALTLAGSSSSPKIAALSPNSGTEAGGTSVTITGAGLGSASAVSFGGVPATAFTVESSNRIVATAPAGHATVDVRVTTGQGSTPVGLADRYRYLSPEEVEQQEAAQEALEGKPTVTGVTPSAVLQSGGTVTLAGANYAGVKAVTFGGEPAATFEVNSATKITAVVPALKTRICSAQVSTSTGTSVVRNLNTLECVPEGSAPTVTAVSPKKGPSGGGTQVTVSGARFAGVTQVVVGGVRATQLRILTEASLTAIVPAHSEGTADVTVTTPNGTSTPNSKDHYKYGKPLAPTVNYVGTASGPKAGGTEVTVGGTNFVTGMSFLFGKIPASVLECIATSCRVSAPAAAKTGAVDIIAVVGKSKSKKATTDRYSYE